MEELDRASIRKLLDGVLLSASDLDAFMLDFFPEIYRRLSGGMDRLQRINLLLTYHEPAELLLALRQTDEKRVNKLLKELNFQAVQVLPKGQDARPSTDEHIHVVCLYADEDRRFYDRLRKHLTSILRSPVIHFFSPDLVPPASDWKRLIKEEVERADVVLTLLSADYLASDMLSEPTQIAMERNRIGRSRVLPILVRAVSLDQPPFAGLAYLPRGGSPISAMSDQDKAWVDVVEAVRNAIGYSRTRSTVASPSATGTSPTKAPQADEIYDIEKIFPQSGRPEYTYVQPAQGDRLVGQLRQLQRVLVVEGASGIGKTTAIWNALRVVGVENPDAQWFRGTDESDLTKLDKLLQSEPKGHIVIDDFHYLPASRVLPLARAMQAAATRPGGAVLKFTVIGVAHVGRQLLSALPNLQTRLEKIDLTRQPLTQLAQALELGEKKANIRFQQNSAILEECEGSFYILQDLCQRLAKASGLERTHIGPAPRSITLGPADVRAELLSQLDGLFAPPLPQLVRIDQSLPAGTPRGAGLVLLWELHKAQQDYALPIDTARDRYPMLSAAFAVGLQHLQTTIAQDVVLAEILYCDGGKTLNIKDPRLMFYLRFLNWSDFIYATGMDSWWAIIDGKLQYRPTGPAAASPSQSVAGTGDNAGARGATSASSGRRFPRSLLEAKSEHLLIPFVGAGVSRAVLNTQTRKPMFPSWSELLLMAADQLDEQMKPEEANFARSAVEISDSQQLINVASRARQLLGSRLWNQFLREKLNVSLESADPQSLALASAVWSLGSKLVVTTNYDKVLEWCCPRRNPPHWDIAAPNEFVTLLRKGIDTETVWHLHGQIDRVDRVILTQDGYHRLYGDNPAQQEADYKAAIQTMRVLLASRTFLFIGFSFTDPAFSGQLRWVREVFGDTTERHYLMVKQADRDLTAERLKDLPIELIPFESYGEPQVRVLNELAQATL